ncbi:MAG: C40 family peptidase [Solirubrobacteraceae bacterium]
MIRAAATGIGGLLLVPILVTGAALGALGSIGVADPSTTATDQIPAAYLQLYIQAGAAYGIPWEILAGIGRVECDHGQDLDPSCTQEGVENSAGAGGPMQFLASTFAEYGVVAPGGANPPDRWNPPDAIYSAANYLRASGAPQDIDQAIYAYNHSETYVKEVLYWASVYGAQDGSGTAAAPNAAAATALSFALSQEGVPYVWGGESSAGYDCSGLVQASYRAAGIDLPRTAQEQFDTGPHLVPGTPLEPGDLVFFGQSDSDVQHVGIVVSGNTMVDAPYTGTVVRIDTFPATEGAQFGTEIYLGATRPTAGTGSEQ